MEVIRAMRRLLTVHERRQVRVVVLLAMVTAVVQTVAVFSIMPFMAVVTSSGGAENAVVQRVSSIFGLESRRSLMIATGATVLGLVLFANILAALSLRRLQLTAWNINHYLSRRLLAVYLHRPYSWFLQRHSSGLSQNLLGEVTVVIQSGLVPLMNVAVRGSEALLVVLLLLIVDPKLTLAAGATIGVVYLLMYRGVRMIQERLGEERAEMAGRRYRVVTEATGGVKEIKSLGAEDEFVRRFGETGPSFVRSKAWSAMLSEVPRYLLEVLSFGTVLAIFLVLLLSGRELQEILPLLVLFGFAGYKLVPSFHQVFSSASRVKFALSSIRTIQADLTEDVGGRQGAESDLIRIERMLEVDRVTLVYPETSDPALDDVSVSIGAGERIGVVGPTGAGKTTFVDVLLGLLLPDEGTIRVDGKPLDMERMGRAWRANVGYVPQSIFLSDDTIARNIAFGVPRERVDHDRVRRVAAMAQLHDFIAELPQGYDTTVGERGVRISGGQRQRIGVARALYREPSLLLFDEATSALDGPTEEALMHAIYGLGKERTMVIVAHRLQTVKRCDRILLLRDGRLADQGTFEELLERNELFRVMASGVAL